MLDTLTSEHAFRGRRLSAKMLPLQQFAVFPVALIHPNFAVSKPAKPVPIMCYVLYVPNLPCHRPIIKVLEFVVINMGVVANSVEDPQRRV